MKYEYRISKYNPSHRDAEGRYLIDEWTEFTDIGKRFNKNILTNKEYSRIESAYTNAIIDVFTEAKIDYAVLTDLENYKKVPNVNNTNVIKMSDLIEVAKKIFRGEYWAKLSVPRRAFVHFGYDFNMYIGVMRLTPNAIKKARIAGLYVEDFNSPYK